MNREADIVYRLSVEDELEEALQALGLFEYKSLPPVTHAMCHPCFRSISEKIADWRSRL